jgi:hypothetical protein
METLCIATVTPVDRSFRFACGDCDGRFVLEANLLQLEDAKLVLDRAGLFHVTALLYKGRRMERQTLNEWRKLGTGELEETGYDGVQETIDYLSGCNDKVSGERCRQGQHQQQ